MNGMISIIQRNGVSAGTSQNTILYLPINQRMVDVFNTDLNIEDHLSVQTDGKSVTVTLAGNGHVIQEELTDDISSRLQRYLLNGGLSVASRLTRKRIHS